jgi:dihydropteroate synthase
LGEAVAALPVIIGILNASPDSFANGGVAAGVDAGLAMIDQGADWLDIGGESTRPGSEPVLPAEEQARVLPLIQGLSGCGVPLSIDTRNASTMQAALDAGATIVNDITGLTHDPASAGVVARAGCRVVLMHMRGTPRTMTRLTDYGDVVAEVVGELSDRVTAAEQAGISRDRIIIDPGIGFAKTAEQNLALLRRLDAFAALCLPILVGVSRKSFIGAYGQQPDPLRRAPGSIAAALFALDRGAAILRVHDVAETVQAVRVWTALREYSKEGRPGALPLDPAGA